MKTGRILIPVFPGADFPCSTCKVSFRLLNPFQRFISFNDARLERKHLNFAWEARGIIDEDISLELQEYLTNDSDLHTHSWLTIAEMKEAIDNPAIEIRSVSDVQTEVPRSACMLTVFYEDICKQISSLLPGTNPLDCKIVFAYDN